MSTEQMTPEDRKAVDAVLVIVNYCKDQRTDYQGDDYCSNCVIQCSCFSWMEGLTPMSWKTKIEWRTNNNATNKGECK